MNNLDLKYIFAGCIVLFIILYFAFPEIKKSLKEKFTHNRASCTTDCTADENAYGTLGTLTNCVNKCMQ